MKRIYKFLLPLSIMAMSSTLSAKSMTHKVKKGDSLYVIAHKHHTTVENLRKLNHLGKHDVLKVGKVLVIARDNKKITTRHTVTSSNTYKIKKGDNLIAIAKKHHTTVSKLRELNHLSKHSILKVGKSLVLPSNNIHYATRSSSEKLSKVLKRKKSKLAFNDIVFKNSHTYNTKAKKMIAIAKTKLGRRYIWGASGSNAFDCSGLTSYVCKLNGINIPRRAIAQSKVGKYVSRRDLKPGDLIFFDTSKHRRGYVNHVGIYIGNGKFIHASSAKHKVITTSLDKPFYAQRFKWARRVAL